MDWIVQNMFNGLFLCVTLTGHRRGHNSFV